MPAEIRNSTFPMTVVDLLPPPGGATSRGGGENEEFDSLLRALTPAERSTPRESPAGQPSAQSPPAASEGRSEQNDYTPPPTANGRQSVAQQRDEGDRNGSRNEPAAAQQTQPSETKADEPTQTDERPVEQSGRATGEQADEAKAEAGSDAVAIAEAEMDKSEKGETVDPTALQLAAAAQVAAAKTEPPPITAINTDGEASPEQLPTAESETKPVGGAPTLAVASSPVEPVGKETPSVSPTNAEAQAEAALSGIVVAEAADAPAAEADLVDPALPAADQAEAKPEEEVVISEAKSTHTGARQVIFHEVPPQQDKAAAADGESADPTAEVTAEADAQPTRDLASSLPVVEASSDSSARDERDRPSAEPASLDATEAVAEPTQTAVEPPAMEAASTESPPADSGARPPAESARSEQRPQQLPPTLVDANQRPAGAPRLAAEVLAGGSREASHARPIEIDSARFLTRVAKAFTAAQQRGGEVQLRLSPPELGSLRVEVKVLDGVMTARVETENVAAKTAVLEHLPQLRERLAEQGVRIERFDVDLMQNGSSGTPDRPADRGPDEGLFRRPPSGRAAATARTAPQTSAPAAGLAASSGLNVIV